MTIPDLKLDAKAVMPIKYFSPNEFRCHCAACGHRLGPFDNDWGMAPLLLIWLELFRRAWGMPVIVTNGFRCGRHNAEVGGAANSRHKIGLAADIRPNDKELIKPFKTLVKGMTEDLKGWEIREYPTFMHVATGSDGAA